MSRINSSGQYQFYAGGAIKATLFSSMSLASDTSLRFNSTVDLAGGSVDVAAARNAAGLGDAAFEVNNGTAGVFRDLEVRAIQFNNRAEPACSASTRGGVIYVAGGASVADTFRICRKDAADVYAYVALY